jgi:uncharacterized protein (TIGR02996 family)
MATQDEPRNPALEQAILEKPDDTSAYMALAGWLNQQGAPRGELITLQVAGDMRAAKALIEKHADVFLGQLASEQVCRDGSSKEAFTWRYGFIHGARLSHSHYADEDFEGALVDTLDALFRHPSGRFLAELAFWSNNDPNEDNLQDLIDLLARESRPTLRKLHFGDFDYPDETEMSWYSIGDLSKLWPAVPNLRTLITQGGSSGSTMAGGMTLGAIDLPALVRAEFRTGGLERTNARAIAAARLPNIEHLEIWYGDDNYGGDASVEDVVPLLERTDLPKLRRLGLRNAQFTDELIEPLATSKLLRQVQELDLSMGVLTGDGAKALVAHRDAFKHLAVLDVSQTYLDDDAVASFTGVAKTIVANDLREDDDPSYRFPVVGE